METQKAQGNPHVQTAPFDVETMIEFSAPATEVVKTFNFKLVENVGTYQKEWFGFFSQRWMENAMLPLKLATCQNLPDVQQVYTGFWKRAAEQYSAEFSQLVDAAQHKSIPVEPQPADSKSRPTPALAANSAKH